MKKLIAALVSVAALAMPAAASADSGAGQAWGAQWQAATGCTYGQIVNMVKSNPNHPSIDGLGAKNALELALPLILAGQHPLPQC